MITATENLRREIVTLLPRLRRFGRTLTRDRDDADDLVQIAVERALLRADQWQPGTRLDSWIFRIMQNAWIDELRSRSRQAATFVDADEIAEPGVHPIDAHDEALAVEQALDRLNDDQRAVVGLVLIEGLAYKEAAQVLDIPVGTLTSRLARAREILQQLLGDAKEGR